MATIHRGFTALFFLVCLALPVVDPLHAQTLDFHKIGQWAPTGRGEDIYSTGDRAFIAMGPLGLCTVDTSDRAHPTIRSHLNLPGNCRTVTSGNGYLFVTAGTNGVHMIDFQGSPEPRFIRTLDTAGEALAVRADANRLFVADGTNGVVMFNLTNLAAPSVRMALAPKVYDVSAQWVIWSNEVTHVQTTNRYLQVAAGNKGLRFFDISDPANPILTSTTERPDGKSAVQSISEATYFIHYYADGGDVYDYDFIGFPPERGQFLGKVNPFSSDRPMTRIVAQVSSFQEPRRPNLLMFDGTNSYLVRNMLVNGGPYSPQLREPETSGALPNSISPNYDCFLNTKRGLVIASGTNIISETSLPGNASSGVRLGGDRVYLSNFQGLQIFQNNADGSLSLRSTYPMSDLRGFDVSGSNVFLTGPGTFAILNVTNISSPLLLTNAAVLLTNQPSTLEALDVTVGSGFAYVSSRNVPLCVLDVSKPNAPTLVKKSSLDGYELYSMNVAGTNLFAAEKRGMASIGIAANKTASLLQLVNTAQSNRGLQVVGTTAYLADRTNGLRIYDVSIAANARLLSTFDTPGDAIAVAVQAPYAYVADQIRGLLVVNISNPSAPTKAGELILPGGAQDVQVRDNRVYISTANELAVWDMSIGKKEQHITISAPSSATTIGPAFRISATSDSGLPVQLSVTGPGSFQSGFFTTSAAGTIRIVASQAGNSEYSPATLERLIPVNFVPRNVQEILFPPIDPAPTVGNTVSISPSSSAGLPVEIIVFGPATFENGLLTISGFGTVEVKVTQAGNREFEPVTFSRFIEVAGLEDAAVAFIRKNFPNLPPAETLPDADADRDGIPNIVEFILGTNPGDPASHEGGTQASIFVSDGAMYLKATFPKPRTLQYPTAVEVAEWIPGAPLVWRSFAPSFDESTGTGSFLWPMTPGSFPLIRFVIQYP